MGDEPGEEPTREFIFGRRGGVPDLIGGIELAHRRGQEHRAGRPLEERLKRPVGRGGGGLVEPGIAFGEQLQIGPRDRLQPVDHRGLAATAAGHVVEIPFERDPLHLVERFSSRRHSGREHRYDDEDRTDHGCGSAFSATSRYRGQTGAPLWNQPPARSGPSWW